jgi:hexosaminidase
MFRLLAILALVGAAHAALMPLPLKMVPGHGHLTVDSRFRMSNSGCPEAALARFRARLARQTGVKFVGGGPELAITCGQPATAYPALGEDESYVLNVSSAGARLDSPTATGALRGLETFSQLIASGADGFEVASVRIEDRPRYPWRGLMLDVSRHWMPPDVIRRNLDAMAAVKLNVLHWHLSDDQGFRVESKLYPKLAELGSDGDFYTQGQIREIVAYAAERGIRVLPEFDIPGHTTAWFVGMPELAAAPGPYSIERAFGIFMPVMAMENDDTYAFLDAFLGEMATLFPDPFFHIGGDEVDDPKARAGQPKFNQRVQALLRKHGKTMVGWDEVLAPGLATDSVVQSWRGPDALAAAAAKGYRGILSYGYYLNYLLPASTHYAVDPGDAPGILGGEACMWAEYVSGETADSRIWPRMAAIAERFWSPKEVRDATSMYDRMEQVSRWLEWTGVQHRAAYLPMLERLAGDGPVEPLRVLGDAVEAAGHDVRTKARKYTSLTPLNRFVDAARSESELARHLEMAVARKDYRTLRAQFRQWAENPESTVPELVPLSRNLNAVGAIGLRAIDYLERGEPAPAGWVREQQLALDTMGRPVAEVILAAVRPAGKLLAALAH